MARSWWRLRTKIDPFAAMLYHALRGTSLIANVLSPENGVAAHKFWDSCAHQLTKKITPDPDYPIGIVLDSLRPTLGGRKEGRRGDELKGVAARRAGGKGARTDKEAHCTAWLFGWFKESSVRFVYFVYFSFPFFSFFPLFPLFVAELICSVHVTEILPLHVCLSPILPPSLGTTGWPEQPVQKVAVVGPIPIPLCRSRDRKEWKSIAQDEHETRVPREGKMPKCEVLSRAKTGIC